MCWVLVVMMMMIMGVLFGLIRCLFLSILVLKEHTWEKSIAVSVLVGGSAVATWCDA